MSDRIEDHLAVITGNANLTAETIAELIAKCEPEKEIDPEDRTLQWWPRAMVELRINTGGNQ
ncbi:hypothetical protein [Pseudomonas sp. GL-B-16]|uniref:hypothetical protein n=1 Tax=Pseudomonas sp. GL-B-16 TaxID=2832373 RepID=UPI002958702A|nr:hypothetical protein [Pseudomonas sp. GL-B-16]